MTRRRCAAGFALAIACLAACAGPARSQGEFVRAIDMLHEPFETKDFTNPMTFKDALQLLYEKFQTRGKEFAILVDVKGFNRVDPDINVYDVQVQLPPVPRQMPTHVALRTMLDQFPVNATFIVRESHIEIVPPSATSIKTLLRKRVLLRVEDVPLRVVLDRLAVQTGAPIILDARVRDKGQERVSLLLNNLSLRDALYVLTEQAGLRYEVLQSGVFVTLPGEPKRVEKKS
jgi:hypothetical protein